MHRSLLTGIMALRRARELHLRWEVLRMIVRMASVRVAPERINEIVGRYRQIVRPVHQRSEGLRNHYMLVDRKSGQMRLMGLWDSPEALEAALPTLEPARERLWEEFGEDPTLEARVSAGETLNSIKRKLELEGVSPPMNGHRV